MLSLLKELESLHPKKFPKYISNAEIESFLNQNKARIDSENFKELKDFFLLKHKLSRSVFTQWEGENKDLFLYKESIQKQKREYPLQNEFEDLLKLESILPEQLSLTQIL